MSAEPPPTYNTSIFNQSYWGISTAGGGNLDDRYLRFPTGQGTETLPALVVTGKATINGITIKSPTGINNVQVGGGDFGVNSTSASYDNVFFGTNISTGVLTGNNNTVVGNAGFFAFTSGSNNTSIGAANAISLSTGSNNVFVGRDVLPNLTTGSNNTAIGSSAGINLSTGSNNTFIGPYSLTSGGGGTSNSTAIGYNSIITASNQIVLGNGVSNTDNVKIPGSLTLKETQPIKGMVAGSVASSSPSTGTVSFGYTFSSTPFVSGTIQASFTNVNFSLTFHTVTTTGFSYVKTATNSGSSTVGAAGEGFNWIAIGT